MTRIKADDFVVIRKSLGKNQAELARLLCISPKAIQSFEQGWRDVSGNAERHMLFLLNLNKTRSGDTRHCWEMVDCPSEWRERCPAWEFEDGRYCWFVNGTFCRGEFHPNWTEKIKKCRSCKMLEYPS